MGPPGLPLGLSLVGPRGSDMQRLDHLEGLAYQARGEAERRLVEEQQAGPRHEAARDGQHLLFAAGKRRRVQRPLAPARQTG